MKNNWKIAFFLAIVAAVILYADCRLYADDIDFMTAARSCNSFSLTASGSNPIELKTEKNDMIFVSSRGLKWGSKIIRGLYSFDAPQIIQKRYPNTYVKSAFLTLNVNQVGCKDTGMKEYMEYLMPGVCAYQVKLANNDSNKAVLPDDFWSPVLNYLGMIVPAETRSEGTYSLDVTDALQDAVDNSFCGTLFGVRLHFGNETNALHADDNLFMEYSFKRTDAILKITLAPIQKITKLTTNVQADNKKATPAESIETVQLNDALAWCSDNRYRVIVEFSLNSALVSNKPVSVELCFPKLLQALGIDDRVDRNSIEVVEYDANTLTPQVFDNQISDYRKYYIPSRVFYPAHAYSQIAYDVVAWKLSVDKSRLFTIYFDTVKNGHKPPRQAYPVIGAGEPFMCYRGDVALPFYGLFTIGDLDGDGLPDIISGGYTENGYLVFLKNLGPREAPLFAEPERISAGSKWIGNLFFEGYGVETSDCLSDPAIWDWDSDGILDLYVRFNPWFTKEQTYYKNVGDSKNFKFATVLTMPTLPIDRASSPCFADFAKKGISEKISAHTRFVLYNDLPVAGFNKFVTRLCGYDIAGAGNKQILVGFLDGTMSYCKNIGTVKDKAYFSQPQSILMSAGPLKAGNFSTPYAVDWNGDGNIDILSGNEDGTIIYFENTGTTANPKFFNRGYLCADGHPIVFPGDPNEPNGEQWAYTSLSALDWRKRGVCDLLISERRGYINYYENIGGSVKADLRFRGRLKLVDGTYALPTPRVKPGFYDWNGDGKYDMIMTTPEGLAAIYFNSGNFGESDGLIFKMPLLLKDLRRNPIYQERYHGQGRTRYVPIDWNKDGLMDLMIFNHAADGWPRYFENKGTRTSPVFVEKAEPMVKDHHLWVGVAHEPCGMAVDWDNDGWQDIILGGEDGLVRYYNRQAFLGPPAIRRMTFSSKDKKKNVYDCRRFADIDRYVEKFTLYGDDLNRAQGSNLWQWRTGVAAHHQDMLVMEKAAGNETIIYDPHLAGNYSISIALILEGSSPSKVKVKLNGESDWQILETTLLKEYQVSPDVTVPKNYFQLLYWKDADLTGKKIEIQPMRDVNIQLDYIKFMPVSRIGVIDINEAKHL